MTITNKSYTRNYIQTYLWQGIAIVLNMASLFIVVPMITENKVVYGVYAVCISTAMFLSYADLGFVSAGIKYAGEAYAKGEHKDELKFYGFSGFILFVFITLIAGIYFLFAYNPEILIKDINQSPYLSIASKLLFIQALFSFTTVLQRYVSGVFQVRIEQYIYQRINIVGSLIKILSVFYFFGGDKYDIVGYYLFLKIIQLATLAVGVWLINRKYKLSFWEFMKAFKFDKRVYQKTKGLAFSSLFVTLMWILYYELDTLVIGKMLGASAVAVFALAFTFMQFLRSLSSVIFSPFQNRYNHFVGLNDMESFKKLLKKVILFSMPLFVLLVLSIVVLNKNIVLTWAGDKYLQSGIIMLLLGINFMYSFITIPGSNIYTALVRIKEMYILNATMVVVFWTGIFLTKNIWGVNSFAIFKLVAGTLAMMFYLRSILRFLEQPLWDFLKETIFRIIVPVFVEISILIYIIPYLPDTKGKMNLFMVIGAGGVATIIGFLTLYSTSKYYRVEYNTYWRKIFKKKDRIILERVN